MSALVTPELLEIALDRVEGTPFENFANAFMAAVSGEGFVPLGGLHDGGADGLLLGNVQVSETNNSKYMQASIRVDYAKKIGETLRRLKETGRQCDSLIYVTSKSVSQKDRVEEELSERHKVRIYIRDRNYLSAHSNDSVGTQSAFWAHLARYTEFLKRIGDGTLLTRSTVTSDPAVYVFLQQEVDRRSKKEGLLQSITDSLILWALRETNPDTGSFLSEGEIISTLERHFPWSPRVIKGLIRHRLQALAKKADGSRKINWHRKADRYCLPFATRDQIAVESASDETLRVRVRDQIQQACVDDDQLNEDDWLALPRIL